MNILTISGSASEDSVNSQFLQQLSTVATEHNFSHCNQLQKFPLFTPQHKTPLPNNVLSFKENVTKCDAVVISTPEYLSNIPAALKNALEWLSSSGEMNEKKIIAITYTPHAPRGEKAMQSLLNTLNALNSRVIGEVSLYQRELKINHQGKLEGGASIDMLKAMFDLL